MKTTTRVYEYLNGRPRKRIRRRIYYDVYFWSKENKRVSKYFESARRAKKFVNRVHNSNLLKNGDYVRMEKTWCYREFTPRHKCYYVSYVQGQFVCVEKY